MTNARTAVSALTLGKAGQTITTPEVVSFTGAHLTVWDEPLADPSAIKIKINEAANYMLVQAFRYDLLLADKAAWVVLADASASGVFVPSKEHTVTLLRFTWDGSVTVVAVVNGHDTVAESCDGIPQEVWDQLRHDHEHYCLTKRL